MSATMTASRAPTQDERFHARFLWAITFLSGAVLWLRPIASSFWEDELVTWWVIDGSFREMLHRSYALQGQSALYYPIAWLMRHVGPQEWVLRLPSLVALVAAAYLLFRLATRLLDRELGRVAVLAFVLWPGIAFEASNARPYAIAVLVTIASVSALVSWLDRGSRASMVVWIVVTALLAYAHIVFVLAIPAQILYAIARRRDGSTRVSTRAVITGIAIVAVLDLGLVPQLIGIFDRRGALVLPTILSFDWFGNLVVPAVFVSALVVGGTIAWATSSITLEPMRIDRSAAVLVLSWLLIPLVTVAVLALTTSVRLLEWRYTMMAAPAGALLVAAVLRAVHPPPARRIIAALLAVFTVWATAGALKAGEDWRWAAATAQAASNAHSVTLLHPGLVESGQLDWFSDPEERSYLLNPTAYYHFPGPVEPVPYVATADSEAFLARELAALPSSVGRINYVTRFPGVGFLTYLQGWASASGWDVTQTEGRGNMVVMTLERSVPAS
jgi:hypothetical protein